MSDDPAVTAAVLRARAARGEYWITARGRSMTPRIPDGARLHVAATQRLPRRGEIWAFVSAEGLVLAHRSFRRSTVGTFVFSGDRGPEADLPVHRDWLIGPVVEVATARGRSRIARHSGVIPIALIVLRGVLRRARAVLRSILRPLE